MLKQLNLIPPILNGLVMKGELGMRETIVEFAYYERNNLLTYNLCTFIGLHTIFYRYAKLSGSRMVCTYFGY